MDFNFMDFLNSITAEYLIHMTASYSNAVLLVVMTNVSDFTKRLDLPVPQPVTTAQVQKFLPDPVKHYVGGSLTLTNGDNFSYAHGHVSFFRSRRNFLRPPDDIEYGEDEKLEAWAGPLFGPNNMTTNEVIEFARDALRKLGYNPAKFTADREPTLLESAGITKDGRTIPFCRVEWNYRGKDAIVNMDVDTNKKQVVGFSIVSTNAWRPDPDLGIKPELEIDYRNRTQGKMFIRTNAPPRPPRLKPPPPNAE